MLVDTQSSNCAFLFVIGAHWPVIRHTELCGAAQESRKNQPENQPRNKKEANSMIYTVTFNPAIDYVVRLGGSLQPGALNRVSAEEYQLGGKGVNVSAVLAELGFASTALGFVAGQTGAWLEQGLAARGIRTDFIRLPAGMTRINVKIKAAYSDASAEPTAALNAGQSAPQNMPIETEINGIGPAIDAAALAALEAKLDALGDGDVLVLAGSIPVGVPDDIYERLMRRLDGRGVRITVDAARGLLEKVLPYHPFLIKPNHHELGELFGRELHTDDEIAACARDLQRRGARNVLVSMAGAGALLLDETGRIHRVGTPKGRVQNSVGAGDSMVAGFLAGWLQTGDYACALRLGTACGSATAFAPGLATRAEIDKLFAELERPKCQ
jgi:1-phosphofructokinase